MKIQFVLAGLIVVGVTAAPAAAQAPAREPRVTLLVDAGLALSEPGFETERTIREFAENGTLRATYTAGSGPVFGGALQVRFGSRLGVLAGGAVSSRDEEGDYEARLPHPLYLNRHRVATGELSGDYKETELFAALALLGRAGIVDLRLFAGPSFTSVQVDTLQAIRYSHAFPFDEVTVQEATLASQDGSGVGFTAGAGADLRLGERLGVGVQARYSRASVSIEGDDADGSFDLDAGGLTATAGIRVRF